MLIIPSTRHIKKLTSAVSVETSLSDNTIKYLEAICQKLHTQEKIGSLTFDEIYTAKRCEFSRSNGQTSGMSNEQPTKTLLSVMFKSIVVAMVPLTKMDSSILYKLFNDVMNATNAIGYDAVVSLVDGHFSNVKLYKKELCADKPTSFIPHPLDQHRFS